MQTTRKFGWICILAAAAGLILSACTTIPTQLQGTYAEISPARVQPDLFGSKVRWGGVLIETRNEKDRTCFEVLSHALDRTMRPVADDTTTGRFIACTNGFHDPQVYANGREVTITGFIQSLEQRKIEEFDYRYPVVEITDMVLWEERENVVIYNHYYDPFFYPYFWGGPYWGFYPYYGYPWPYYGPLRGGPRQSPRGDVKAHKPQR